MCDMVFTVLQDGSVDADSIVADCNDDLFVDSSTRAIAQWRYEPIMVNGQAVKMGNMTARLTFSFERAEP